MTVEARFDIPLVAGLALKVWLRRLVGLEAEDFDWNSLARSSVQQYAFHKAVPAQRLLASAQQFVFSHAYQAPGSQRPHNLPSELIVSLTSYPRRFPILDFTIRSLLNQTVRPDRVILWLAEDDVKYLPSAVRRLAGLEIRTCRDLRSFNKLVPALQEFPRAFVATADDDLFYRRSWLEELVDGWASDVPTIQCHRAHRMPNLIDGTLPPYRSWEWDVQDERSRKPSIDLVGLGVGGVLYYPGCLHPEVVNYEKFLKYCPQADDLWFYWQARRAGTSYAKVGGRFPLAYWAGSQGERLFDSNTTGNDDQARNLLNAYGHPGG
jgi:hypothetical protein